MGRGGGGGPGLRAPDDNATDSPINRSSSRLKRSATATRVKLTTGGKRISPSPREPLEAKSLKRAYRSLSFSLLARPHSIRSLETRLRNTFIIKVYNRRWLTPKPALPLEPRPADLSGRAEFRYQRACRGTGMVVLKRTRQRDARGVSAEMLRYWHPVGSFPRQGCTGSGV